MVLLKSKKVSIIPKILLTLFTCILVPVYWVNYGPTNFLWLSDIGLFLTVAALWLESPLLISIAMVGISPMEFAWMIDFFAQITVGYSPLNMANYMFDPQYSLFLRGLSLFHVVTPTMWVWYFFKWGYNRHAFKYATALVWSVFIVTYLITEPEKNINWVFTPQLNNWQIHPVAWIGILMFGFLTVFFIPLHVIFLKTCKRAR